MYNNENSEILTIKSSVIKLRNSKSRYLKIPDEYFKEINHDDEAEVLRSQSEGKLFVVFSFDKEDIKNE